jgi:hypothetical protein
MQKSGYPSLYQINTRVWLTELSRKLGRSATLDDIPDTELDRIAEMGFDWVWFLSVWQTGLEGQRVSRSNAGWREEFQHTLSCAAAAGGCSNAHPLGKATGPGIVSRPLPGKAQVKCDCW